MNIKKKVFSNILYLVIIVLIIMLGSFVNTQMTNILSKTYRINIPLALLNEMIIILFGAMLGLEYFLKEFRKIGKWNVDYTRILIMGLPILILIVVRLLPLVGIDIGYNKVTFFLIEKIKLFEILLGYTIISSFKKVEVS